MSKAISNPKKLTDKQIIKQQKERLQKDLDRIFLLEDRCTSLLKQLNEAVETSRNSNNTTKRALALFEK